MLQTSLENYSKKVSEKTGVSFLKVESIVKGYNNQIRKGDSVTVTGQLIIQIPLIAKEYGTRFDISENVITESIRLVFRKFGYLGIEEIREAYREYYSGNSSAKGADAYGGEFSVAQLGKILTAYTLNRKMILASYLKLQEEEQRIQEEEQNHKLKQEKFNQEFPAEVVRRFASVKEWSDIPSFYWRIFKKNKWVSFEEGEAEKIFRLAKLVARKKKQSLEEEKRTMIFSERIKCAIPELNDMSKIIAGQLTIWYKCIKDEKWLIEFSRQHNVSLSLE